MKNILLIISIMSALVVNGQVTYKDTLKIAFLGDSFCGGGNSSTFDSSWVGRTVYYYKGRYSKVIYYQLCTGGETTYKGLPVGSWFPPGQDYYSKPDSNRNITKVLSVLGPATAGSVRMCFLEYSGNDLWIGNPQDSLRKNLLYLIGVLQENGIDFAVSGISPRQQSGASGNLLAATYYTGADSMNVWLPSIYPDNFGNIWDSLLRTNPASPYGKMKVAYLSGDSVHPNNTGHRYQFEGMVRNAVNDKLYCNCKGRAAAINMIKTGDSVNITSPYTIGYRYAVSVSDDYINFTTIATYRVFNGAFNKTVAHNGKLYMRIEIESGYPKKITWTKRIN